MEIWKSVKGYEGRYEVSSSGLVRSLKYKRGNSIKVLAFGCSGGYYNVKLYNNTGVGKTINVHLLMGITFLNHTPNKKTHIDHIDNDRKNNHLDNIQIISCRENSTKDRVGGTSKYVGVFRSPYNTWTARIMVNGRKKYLGAHKTQEAARAAVLNCLYINNIENKYA